MRHIITCVIIICLSTPAAAGVRHPKTHTTDAAAMGYADIASSGPAAAALDQPGGGFRAISIDARGTLSEGFRVLDWVEDISRFKDNFTTNFTTVSDALRQVDNLKSITESSGWTLGAETRVDLLRFSFSGPKLGYLAVGAYAELSVGVRAPKLDVDAITWRGTHIDIGSRYKALSAKGWADGGIRIEYGRPIKLPKGMTLGLGVANKVFHRLDLPEHAIVLKQKLRTSDDIEVPDISYDRGWGFGMDLFASVDVNDQYVGTRASVEIRNAPTITCFSNGAVADMVMVGAGFSIHPLRKLGFDAMTVAGDLEVFEDGVTAIHTGTSWHLGNQRFHFTPSIGSAILGRDVWGNSYHSFTAGFSAKVAVLELAGVFEYFGSGRYDAGARIAIGW